MKSRLRLIEDTSANQAALCSRWPDEPARRKREVWAMRFNGVGDPLNPWIDAVLEKTMWEGIA